MSVEVERKKKKIGKIVISSPWSFHYGKKDPKGEEKWGGETLDRKKRK